MPLRRVDDLRGFVSATTGSSAFTGSGGSGGGGVGNVLVGEADVGAVSLTGAHAFTPGMLGRLTGGSNAGR